MNLHIYGWPIFNKDAKKKKKNQWEKASLSNKQCWDNWITNAKKKKKNEAELLTSHRIQKVTQMDQRPKYKS